LQSALQPLLTGSALKLGEFQNQGWDVLQGIKPDSGVSLEELQARNNASTNQPIVAANAGTPGGRP
jgi:hypothetical protein